MFHLIEIYNTDNCGRAKESRNTQLWQEIADLFGTDATLLHNRNHFEPNIKIRIHTIPSKMRSFVMTHLCDCEVTGPKRFRDEIQKAVMDAYKKYW